ncbi:MAG: penicillin-binding transpeptidase domain-containing protein, partial [Candidatus Acidiferrum sp.]
YTPNNYGEKFLGKVTLRQALTNSLNVATVKVAEMIGYGRVVQIARQMGLTANIRPTPAVALGAYELTPVDIAEAYTAFATMGTRAEGMYVKSVSGANGNVLEKNSPTNKLVLDPRVAYLVDSILVDVINKGTGAAVRAKGFTLPAAGKTGTSRDGWFAGFTNNLVCVIWIGFDDNHDLGLSGGATAAPMWADFMIKATTLPGYRDVQPFEKPDGVDEVVIDADTLEIATPSCPATREEVYIAGSQPTQLCELHGGHGSGNPVSSFLSHIFGGGSPKPPQAVTAGNGVPGQNAQNPADPNSVQPAKATEKKKGPLQRFFGIFGGKKKKDPDADKPDRDKGDSP